MHVVALKNDGTLYAWGENTYGQTGNGSYSLCVTIPTEVGLSNVVSVSGGGFHVVVAKSDGTVWSWGKNEDGQLGIGTINCCESVPTQT